MSIVQHWPPEPAPTPPITCICCPPRRPGASRLDPPPCPSWCIRHGECESRYIHHLGNPVVVKDADSNEHTVHSSLLVDLIDRQFEAVVFVDGDAVEAHQALIFAAVLQASLLDVCEAETAARAAGFTQFPGWEPVDPAVMTRAEAFRSSLDTEGGAR